MKHFNKFFFGLIILSMAAFQATSYGQGAERMQDSVRSGINIVKWNLTPFLIWSPKNINLSYERTYQPYKSFSVNAGYFELPSLTKGIMDSLQINRSVDKGGFTISADHRWYFKKRNPGEAPDGLYWGVYGSFHHYQFNNVARILESPVISGDLDVRGRLDIISTGVELGYQFIIKEKLSIDLVVVGPSLSLYRTSLGLSGAIEADREDEYLKAIYNILSSTIPGFDELVRGEEVVKRGFNDKLGIGIRYLVQIGYRF